MSSKALNSKDTLVKARAEEAPPSDSHPPNRLENASPLSKFFFHWAFQLLKLGTTRPLTEADIPHVPNEDKSAVNANYLDRIWKNEQDRNPNNPKLYRAIFRDYLKTTWFIQPILACTSIAKVMQSVSLGFLIESFSEERGSGKGYIWAGVLVICSGLALLEHQHVFYLTWRKGMQLRIAAVAAIYAKSLRLSSTNKQDTASSKNDNSSDDTNKENNKNSYYASAGKTSNLASNDVERFLLTSLFISYLFWSPLRTFATLGVGIWLLGPAFAVGFVVLMFVVVPLQVYLAKKFGQYRSQVAAITDRRVTLVSQAVSGARVMKMSGWEWQLLDRISAERKKEISQISKANRLKVLNETLFFCSNVVIIICIFLVHVLGLGKDLTPQNVFTVLSLINLVQVEMTKYVPLAVMTSSECVVSIGRIQQFLELPEIPDNNTTKEPSGPALTLDKVSCYWNQVANNEEKDKNEDPESDDSLVCALSEVSLELERGRLTCIIGGVGSGKSALLQALVGELPIAAGDFKQNYKSLAYAAQDPWIMDGTVRDNILMGLPWDEKHYDGVIKACGLAIDFEQLANGDETLVGDRGVRCSGGQRARIGLARALYKDADVLVLDDPLSAVDARVSRILFFDAIMGLGVNRGKCVVLATHQHQFITEAHCVLMAKGKIECIGSYKKCVDASGGNILVPTADNSIDNLATGEEVCLSKKKEKENSDPKDSSISSEKKGKDGGKDVEEMNVTGLVRAETFINYSKAMGGVWVGLALVVLFTLAQVSVIFTLAIIGQWAERPVNEQRDRDIIGLVVGLGCCVALLTFIRTAFSFWLTVKASRRLHDNMTKAVLRAKIEFFDTNPLGRILNRFSADVGVNDDLLPQAFFEFIMISFIVLGALATAVAVLPFILIAIPPLMWYFIWIRRIFVTSSRELKRLEALGRSPIFSMLSESLSGVATIRSNGYVPFFQKRFQEAHDRHSRAFFAFIASSRWVGFRLDGLMFLFISIAAFLSVLFHQEEWFNIDPAILGLALAMLLQLTGVFQLCVRKSAEVVNFMVSVERVLGFGNLESEPSLSTQFDEELPADWPEKGAIAVQNLSARYRQSLPLTLEGVSCTIPAGKRIGVVGRTGSGKSTLVQCLFRLLEAERGSIEIDGVDIANVGLHTLRKRLSVIPQVPVLFSGCSVRENLDPFSLHSDKELMTALEDVCMLEPIQELSEGLESVVAEGGSNFSVGQRQLLCLARAILNRNRVLILDEPTANVDGRTDQLLQESLKKSFRHATIISVAHRLDTIIDYDYILVLGGGRVLEFGSPAELVQQTNGFFASMVNDTGHAMANKLRKRALGESE